MPRIIYDEEALVDSQIYKADKFRKSRINRFTGDGRTPVTYFNLCGSSTQYLGTGNASYLGQQSPLRFNQIKGMYLLDLTPLSATDENVADTELQNMKITGEGYVPRGTIQPNENDFFIIKEVKMNHIMRITDITEDGLVADGCYKIEYELYSSEPSDLDHLKRQTEKILRFKHVTHGGEDLNPILSEEDFELRSRLMLMYNDMVDSYTAMFYNRTHNCFLCDIGGRTLFDPCANHFMAKHGLMIIDNADNNVVLNENKLNTPLIEKWYQDSPFKWLERDAPIRHLDPFRYSIGSTFEFPDTSFFNHADDFDVVKPFPRWGDPNANTHLRIGQYFSMDVFDILSHEQDSRVCNPNDCLTCPDAHQCIKNHKMKRFDYVSLIHDFVHGRLRDFNDLSLYIGDQLFDNSIAEETYLWSPMILYILRQVIIFK
jgi:hypothetical protein